jgi:hypothetical protein
MERVFNMKKHLLSSFLFVVICTIYVQGQTSESIINRKIIVPDMYSSLNIALEGAKAGDTIYLKNGTYHENVIFCKKNISNWGRSV